MIGDRLLGAVVTADRNLGAANRDLYAAIGDLPVANWAF